MAAIFFIISCSSPTPPAPESDGPGHPAWQEDWLRMKKEKDTPIPEDFTLKMYQLNHEASSSSRVPETNFGSVEELGPDFVAGRIRAFIVDHSNPNRYLAAGISGGLWESLDLGQSWINLMPNESNLNITSITQSPFDADVFYFSTGESTGNSAGISGVGIFKSVDGGLTFELIPSSMVSDFFTSWRIEHSLSDSHTVYVATRNGLFVTRDEGEFFDQILFQASTDIEILPGDEMYIGTDGQGVFYSPDGSDESFTRVDNNFPPFYGRTELAVAANKPHVIAAALEDEDSGRLLKLYYSGNAGVTWDTLINPRHTILNTSFTWYCNTLFVHPSDSTYLIFGASDGAYTTNRGQSWSRLRNIHADIHSATLDPRDSTQILMTSDGGIDRFERLFGDNLNHIENLNNGLNITQFYTGAVFPNGDLIGGTQDNGTWYLDQRTGEFDKLFGGDGAYCAVNPLDSNQAYLSYQRANVFRNDNFYRGGAFGYISDDIDYSEDGTWFINPFQLNPTSPNQVYLPTTERLWWSQDFGDSWEPLTDFINDPFRVTTIDRGDSTTVFVCGGQATFYRIDNVENHVAGEEISLRNSAPTVLNFSFMREMVMHPDGNSIYAVFSSFSRNPRVWHITDIYSDDPTWTPISGDLPEFLPVNTIQVDPLNVDVMAIGTDYGLYTTRNGGDNWILEREIPQTVIFQIVLHTDNSLYIFTHGRGIFQAELNNYLATDNINQRDIQLSVFPNPSTEVISLNYTDDLSIKQMQIIGMDGRIHQHVNQYNTDINVSGLNIGNYILLVEFKNGERGQARFVKK